MGGLLVESCLTLESGFNLHGCEIIEYTLPFTGVKEISYPVNCVYTSVLETINFIWTHPVCYAILKQCIFLAPKLNYIKIHLYNFFILSSSRIFWFLEKPRIKTFSLV